jgi:hypothetical protein
MLASHLENLGLNDENLSSHVTKPVKRLTVTETALAKVFLPAHRFLTALWLAGRRA